MMLEKNYYFDLMKLSDPNKILAGIEAFSNLLKSNPTLTPKC
jgi:hypothetical protein